MIDVAIPDRDTYDVFLDSTTGNQGLIDNNLKISLSDRLGPTQILNFILTSLDSPTFGK